MKHRKEQKDDERCGKYNSWSSYILSEAANNRRITIECMCKCMCYAD